MQDAYEARVVKHEEFTQLIKDDNEFEEQEAWRLAGSRDAFQVEENQSSEIDNRLINLSSSKLSKGSIQRSKEIASNNLVIKEYSSSNDAQVFNVIDISGNASLSKGAVITEACRFSMEKLKTPKLSNDVRECAIFRDDLKHAIQTRYSKRDCLTYLRTCLQGRPLELMKGIGYNYDAAWEYLDSIYADPR